MREISSILITLTFFASGCAALIYQIVWQRYLYTGLGVDIDSVTLIVSTFMLGIGLGGALGGWLADKRPRDRLKFYGFAELALAVFGALSPWFFWGVQSLSGLGWSYAGVGAVAISMVLVPTTIMGTTLPVLTMYFDESLANVGVSVGMLYFFNTLGAAFGAWLTANFLFVSWGLNFSVWVASLINLGCFGCILLGARLDKKKYGESSISAENRA